MRLFRRQSASDLDGNLWLVVGLGNPGNQYAQTRHNIGFMALDLLAQQHDSRWSGSKHEAEVTRLTLPGRGALLAKPLTYMNDSGYAVGRLARYHRIPPEHILVVCDDLDLPFGTLRLRPNGSSGGQRGLQSVIQVLGTSDIPRLRLGIGRPERNAIKHVLQRFSPEQEAMLPGLLDIAAEAISAVVSEGVTPAMNRFNRDWLPELSM